jgi:general secretion pathway protein D
MAIAAVSLACTGVLLAKTKKGDKLLNAGKAAEIRQDWDKALALYEQAIDEDPNDPSYMIAMRRARFQAGQKHVNLAQKLRTDGKLEEALSEFQKALIADPASPIAIQEIKRTRAMIDGQNQAGAKPEDRGLTPADRIRKEADERVASIMAPPELKPITGTIPTLKMNNQPPRVLYETVGKLAGVNVVFDSQYAPPGRNFNVDLNNAPIDQAFDYLAVLTHTFWKPISSNTIFVTEDNVTKRRDYEDEVVRVFYITNTTTVQEFQEIATAIRTVAEIRRVFTYNAQKAMVVRGTLDQVALAEKLVHDLDKPKSEVIVDVLVMEANSERTRDLAATIASAGTAGLNVPVAFTPSGILANSNNNNNNNNNNNGGGTTIPTTTPTTTSTSITLGQLGHLGINDWSTSLPGALLQAMLTDSRTKVLNNPQVRASDGQKVSLKIGNRIPYATGSFQPGVGTVGVSPLVSTQFNYADVGVNLDITPQVHSTDEVTMHVEVTVSSVQQYVNLGGISQPVIGQRVNTADIRLREGEVNILGGLSQLQDSSVINGIPGLVSIPVLGKALFGSEHTDKVRGELLIALIPHIVRTPDYTAENLRGIYAGSDQVVKLYYAPKKDDGSPTAAGPSTTAPPEPAKPEASAAPAEQPQPAASAANPAQTAGAQTRVSFQPGTVQAKVSGMVSVNVQVDNPADLFSTALTIKFDPAKLRLNDIAPGDLLSRDGNRVTSVKDIRNDTGEATLTVTRLPGSPGVSASGSIATLSFTAVGGGQSTVTAAEMSLKNSQQQPLPAVAGELPVTIQ